MGTISLTFYKVRMITKYSKCIESVCQEEDHQFREGLHALQWMEVGPPQSAYRSGFKLPRNR